MKLEDAKVGKLVKGLDFGEPRYGFIVGETHEIGAEVFAPVLDFQGGTRWLSVESMQLARVNSLTGMFEVLP